MPEKLAAALGLKKAGIFLMGAVASRDWIMGNWSDLIKLGLLIGGFVLAMQLTLQKHTLAIEKIASAQEHIAEQQTDTTTIMNQMVTTLTLLEYRLSEAERVTKGGAK